MIHQRLVLNMRVALFFLIAFVSLDFSNGATTIIPMGGLWFLKSTGTFHFANAKEKCEEIKGSFVSINSEEVRDDLKEFLEDNPAKSSEATDVWTSAVKLAGKEGFFWDGDVDDPVNPDIIPLDPRTTCEEECCSLKYSLSEDLLMTYPCSSQVTARFLCQVNPERQMKEDLISIDIKIGQELHHRTLLAEGMEKVTNTKYTEKTSIDALAKSKTTLFVLYGLSLVGVIALGLLIFLIWRRA